MSELVRKVQAYAFGTTLELANAMNLLEWRKFYFYHASGSVVTAGSLLLVTSAQNYKENSLDALVAFVFINGIDLLIRGIGARYIKSPPSPGIVGSIRESLENKF